MPEKNNTSVHTYERFLPGTPDPHMELEHYQRYYSILPIVKDKLVLDAACGEGYGSSILSSAAKKVTGVDIDVDTIHHAEHTYAANSKIEFFVQSVEQLSMQDNSFDVVVSFETIEHLPDKVQQKFLTEIARVLKRDGILIMSTPNKEIYSDRFAYRNEFHIKEFYKDEFLAFLHQSFLKVHLYYQYFEIVSIIDSASGGNKDTNAVYKKNPNYNKDGKYLIAIAGNGMIPKKEISHIYLNPCQEYETKVQRILQLQQEVEERNSHLKELDKEIDDNRKRIYEQEQAIREYQQEVEERNNHLKKLDQEIADNRKKICEQEQTIQECQKEIAFGKQLQKDAATKIAEGMRLLEQKEHVVRQQEVRLRKDEQKLAELNQEILNKQGHIEQLLESEREFERIKKSRTWRVAAGMQKASFFIVPPGSYRRLFAKMLLRFVRHPVQSVKMLSPMRVRHLIGFLREEGAAFVARRIDESMPDASYTAMQPVLQESPKELMEKPFASYEVLHFPKVEHPLVSIVIPVYNQFSYTYGCLKSILEHTGSAVSYEVLVADDHSTDDTTRLSEVAENIRIIRNEQNLLFLKNCNHAASYARGAYLLFLNNDTQVQKDWLEPLTGLMERDQAIGMAGSKLIYPDGRLQEAGGIVWQDGSAWNYGNGQEADRPEYNYVKEVDYISGASLMVRKELWDAIGGFDERFAPAYCEDSDLAFAVRSRGYKTVYQPLSVVVHFEGISNGTDTDAGIKQYQVENSKKLLQKWADVLKHQEPNAHNVFCARERSKGKPMLLMIDHYVPQYDQDAGSKTVYQYLRMFVQKGFQVKMIGDNFYRHEPYTSSLEQLGIEVLYGSFYKSHIWKWLDANHKYFDFVFLNRPHISIKYIDYFYNKTNVKIIYYGHDLHFLRSQRAYELTGNTALQKEAKEWMKQELYLMEHAAISYYPSYVEVQEIHNINAKLPVKAVTAYVYDTSVPDIQTGSHADFSGREGMLFVGGFVHEPNLNAVRWFVRDILPFIRKSLDAPFYIVGSHVPKELEMLDGTDGICVKGYISEEELQKLYASCRLSVVPLRYGAGVKGKVVEAARYGVPVVTTSVGAEGIQKAGHILHIQDEPQAFAEEIVRLYNDTDSLRETAERMQEYVKTYFSTEAVWKCIEEDFVIR